MQSQHFSSRLHIAHCSCPLLGICNENQQEGSRGERQLKYKEWDVAWEHLQWLLQSDKQKSRGALNIQELSASPLYVFEQIPACSRTKHQIKFAHVHCCFQTPLPAPTEAHPLSCTNTPNPLCNSSCASKQFDFWLIFESLDFNCCSRRFLSISRDSHFCTE